MKKELKSSDIQLDLYSRIYEIKGLYDYEKLNDMFSKYDDDVKREIVAFNENITKVEIDEKLIICIFNPIDLEKFNRLSDITGIPYILTDITEDIYLGRYDADDDVFSDLIVPFLKENMTIDMVLDKINLVGLENLSEIDKEVLKS